MRPILVFLAATLFASSAAAASANHGASLAATRVDAPAGTTLSLPVALWSNATSIDHAHLTIRGGPPGTAISPRTIKVAPEKREAATLTLTLPRDARGANYDLSIDVDWFTGTAVDPFDPDVSPWVLYSDHQEVRLHVHVVPPEDSVVREQSVIPERVGPTHGLGTLAAVMAAGALLVGWSYTAMASERGRWRLLLSSILSPLYSRQKRSDVLNARTRRQVYETIVGSPGMTYAELRRATGLANGTILYQTRILTEHGLVTSRKSKLHRRFYAVGKEPLPQERMPPTPAQRRVLDLIRSEPLTRSEIQRRLGLTQQGISYHVRRLEQSGHVRTLPDGRVATH